MRYLAFIFTIYVMALSAWPCCGNETDLPSSHEDACYSASDNHTEKHESPHACSPFFHASTYHAFVASATANKVPALVLDERNNSFPDYLDVAVSLFPGDIWQPPQWV
ncbi:hypothetical protein SAMN04487898_101357 [Pedobacter sp. ok626]|uniref:hypothetical protein n=1 Tax=Pedobacter sp. ok626 TaxID=1761882 RepID=UPI00087E5605|nr:hypothetical protein [Pedobacter sp. ok626]SDJ11591.1 hypothetical protein SAMN04487898_101357 [Pedobacter sp. ok626]